MHSVHYWNLALVYLEHDDVTYGELLGLHPQKQNVAATKGRLHAATEDNDNGAFTVADYHEELPNHESGCHYEAERDDLSKHLPLLHGAKGKHHFPHGVHSQSSLTVTPTSRQTAPFRAHLPSFCAFFSVHTRAHGKEEEAAAVALWEPGTP